MIAEFSREVQVLEIRLEAVALELAVLVDLDARAALPGLTESKVGGQVAAPQHETACAVALSRVMAGNRVSVAEQETADLKTASCALFSHRRIAAGQERNGTRDTGR